MFPPNIHTDEVFQYSADEAIRNTQLAKAVSAGLVVVVFDAATRLITIDADSGELRQLSEPEVPKGIKADHFVTTSKSGKRHYYLRTSESISIAMRTVLACLYGSDPMREYLSFVRHEAGISSAWVMFETPTEFARLEPWLRKNYIPFSIWQPPPEGTTTNP